MIGQPLGKLARSAALFGLMYAALAMVLFGYPFKGALFAGAVAGPLFAVGMHLWIGRKRNGTGDNRERT